MLLALVGVLAAQQLMIVALEVCFLLRNRSTHDWNSKIWVDRIQVILCPAVWSVGGCG